MKNITQKLLEQEFINSLCYFSPLILLAIFLHQYSNISMNDVGILMVIGSIASRWGRIILAPFFDLLPINKLFALFQLIGATGYWLLAHAEKFAILMIAISFIGLCFGSNSIMIRVLTMNAKNIASKNFAPKYAILHIATNMSGTLGPLLFNLAYTQIGARIAFNIVATIWFISAIYSYCSMKNCRIDKQLPWFNSLITLIFNKKYFSTYIMIMILWFFYAQMFSLAPMLISQIYNHTDFVWIITAVNGGAVVSLSVFLNKFFAKKFNNYYMPIIVAFIVSLFGLLLFLNSKSIIDVALGTLMITIAEILFIPSFNNILGNLVDTQQKVIIFSINALCVGVGESLGYYYGITTVLNKGNFNNSSATLMVYIILILGLGLAIITACKNNVKFSE